jgi:hypothetical protein
MQSQPTLMTATHSGAAALVEPVVDDGDLTSEERKALDEKQAALILGIKPESSEE